MPASGLWVKVGASLPRHYKTLKLAEMLALPVHEVIGKLVSLWIYTVEFANEGILTADDIRRGFFSADEPQDDSAVDTVIAALRDCGRPSHEGFIEEFEALDDDIEGDRRRFGVHDWTDYSGVYQPCRDGEQEVNSRASYKKRKKKGEKKEETPTPCRDVSIESTAQASKVQNSYEGTREHYDLPEVKTPLVMSAGESFKSIFENIRKKYGLDEEYNNSEMHL